MEAIRTGNVRAVKVLSGRETEIDTFRDQVAWGAKGVVPSTLHLRIAVLEGGCNEGVVGCLLGAQAEGRVDVHDPAVWEWLHKRMV